MHCEDYKSVSFLKEGGDEDFESIMKNLQDFSAKFLDDNEDHKIDYEVDSTIKSLDNYYNNKMNFDKNEMTSPPVESMNKLDSLYDKIMESKNDKDLTVKRNREYMGDPKESELQNSKSKKNRKTISINQSSKEENPNNFQSLSKKNQDNQEFDYYKLQSLQTQEEKFDKSYYEYPIMNLLPEINNYDQPQINNYPNTNNPYVAGIPIYNERFQPPQNTNYQNGSIYYQQPPYSYPQNVYNYYPSVGPSPSAKKFDAFAPNIN